MPFHQQGQQDTANDSSEESRLYEGLAARRDVMGTDYVSEALGRAEGSDSATVQEFITDTVWGGVWTRPGLDRRSRSLLTLGILIALQAHEELAGHVRGALRNGLSRTEITETIVHASGYCGAPAAMSAMRTVQHVLDTQLGPLSAAEGS